MLNKKECELVLSHAMSSNADFAELFEEEGVNEAIGLLNDKVETMNRTSRSGIGIRLYKGVQSVYGYSNETDMDSLFALVEDLAQAFGKAEPREIVLEETVVKNNHPVVIEPLEASIEEKIDLLQRAYKSAKEVDERIFKVQSSIGIVKQYVQISNSNGKLVKDTRTRVRLAVHAYAKDGDNMQSGFEGPGASSGLEFFEQRSPESVGKIAAETAILLLNAKDCPSGKMPVIIDNGFGGVVFHESCGHSLEATAVAKNLSVFTNKLGQQIASTKVTAIDDGTIPNGWGSQNVDDEGNLQQKRVLIKDGILNSYMIDTLNGRRMGMESTGSSRRQSYKFEPTSRMSNTYIAAGTDKFEDMFVGIEKGLYAKKMGGGSVNPKTGEFNFSVSVGYMIENGKITYPVKGASLIGKGSEILLNIDMVSDNLLRAQGMCGSSSGSIPTDVGQPAIRISSITVGGTANE
ncbi:MAG: TldD/PmbA family protein [Firmicutes bacterium]|nr:TldD/PmbA family protein [Bacillota bacterium]